VLRNAKRFIHATVSCNVLPSTHNNFMNKFLQFFLMLLFISGCTKNEQKNEKEPVLIKVNYYPSFSQNVEAIINLNENYIAANNPSPDYPPYPRNVNDLSDEDYDKMYKKYFEENPFIDPIISDLTDEEILNLKNILKEFKSEDYLDFRGIPANDGRIVYIMLIFSDKTMKIIDTNNGPTNNQRKLIDNIFELIIAKKVSEKNKIIFEK